MRAIFTLLTGIVFVCLLVAGCGTEPGGQDEDSGEQSEISSAAEDIGTSTEEPDAPTPEPAETPEPTATPSATPSNTPTATNTPRPTDTQTVAPTETASPTPEPSETPAPTTTNTVAPEPTATDAPAAAFPAPSGPPLASWQQIPVMPQAVAGDNNGESYYYSAPVTRQDIESFYTGAMPPEWQPLAVGTDDSGNNVSWIFTRNLEESVSIWIVGEASGMAYIMIVKS